MDYFSSTYIPPVQPKSEADMYAGMIQQANFQRAQTIQQIGELFVKENLDAELSNSPYAGLINTVKEIDKRVVMLEKQSLATKGFKKCFKCSNILPLDSGFCNKCGSQQPELEREVVIASRRCPKCGLNFNPGDAFCFKCGYKF